MVVVDISYLKKHPNIKGVAPKSIIKEVKSTFFQKISGNLQFLSPNKEYRKIVKQIALDIGIIDDLSEADIDICALALQLKDLVLTNDFSIQNLCYFLNVPFDGDVKISEAYIFRYKCNNCGYISNRRICPKCGSVAQSFIYKKFKVQKS